MSIAIVPNRLYASPTWQCFQLGCGYVAVAILAGCVIYAVETLVLHSQHRFVENPVDAMTRAAGLAHFSIGWLFLFTSSRLRNREALARLASCTVFGVAFCWLFAWVDGDKNPLALMAFYSFFFIHEAFDEAHLFRQSGEFAARGPETERFLRALCWTVALILVALLGGIQLARGHLLGRFAGLQEMPTAWLTLAWMFLGCGTVIATASTLRLARLTFGSIREAGTILQPLLAVYAGLIAILFVGSLFGSIGANFVILLHGMMWLLHTQRRMNDRPTPASGVWSWLRGTSAGLLTLHLALIALALLLFAMRTHVWQRTGFVCDLVSRTWFPYWGIMHIATSFWRGRG